MHLLPGEQEVLHFPKGTGDDPGGSRPERFETMPAANRAPTMTRTRGGLPCEPD